MFKDLACDALNELAQIYLALARGFERVADWFKLAAIEAARCEAALLGQKDVVAMADKVAADIRDQR